MLLLLHAAPVVVGAGPKMERLPPLTASIGKRQILFTANVRPEKLYCSICKELIHREPFQAYTSTADFSLAEHDSEVGCDESRRMARALESWMRVTGQIEEPDIVY